MTDIPAVLTAWDHVQIARHPQRPHTLDYIRGLCEEFVELRGDRRFGDDAAIVGGLARFDGRTVALLGHQKGSNTKENIRHNFGSPHPEGYRKALRVMRHAEKFGFPLLCFIDTPGASPNMESEERGQGWAIAENLLAMADLEVPIIATVIGEGGSGGALAIGVADRLIMLEHAIYSVASPEGSAAILFRDASKAPEAARAMKITAADLQGLGIVDEVVPEVAGGAHLDVPRTIADVGEVLRRHLHELLELPIRELLHRRYQKYRNIGVVHEMQAAAVAHALAG
ncbi:MAG: acetyl-CoA carboxylase carboxyltransferase subunit alpha [Chloroflexota bacterium]|nr:acetyl-CoA carboxylase carboxyltransferase subunit alpha [Chloroflexota bacterium]